jgi:hypothetical protein
VYCLLQILRPGWCSDGGKNGTGCDGSGLLKKFAAAVRHGGLFGINVSKNYCEFRCNKNAIIILPARFALAT